MNQFSSAERLPTKMDRTEQHYFSRVDLDGSGEQHAEAAHREVLAYLESAECLCGASKTRQLCLCPKCHFELPIEVRSKLYRVRAYADLDLWERAKELLRRVDVQR